MEEEAVGWLKMITTLEPLLTSAALAFKVYLVADVNLMTWVVLSEAVMVSEAVEAWVTVPQITRRVSALGVGITNNRLTVKTFWLLTSPMAMTKLPTTKSDGVPSLFPASLMTVSGETIADRVCCWWGEVMVRLASVIEVIEPTKARLATAFLI